VLNEDSQEKVSSLPRVGPALAEEIIRRRKFLRFTKPAELLQLKGVGIVTYCELMENEKLVFDWPPCSAYPYVPDESEPTVEDERHVVGAPVALMGLRAHDRIRGKLQKPLTKGFWEVALDSGHVVTLQIVEFRSLRPWKCKSPVNPELRAMGIFPFTGGDCDNLDEQLKELNLFPYVGVHENADSVQKPPITLSKKNPTDFHLVGGIKQQKDWYVELKLPELIFHNGLALKPEWVYNFPSSSIATGCLVGPKGEKLFDKVLTAAHPFDVTTKRDELQKFVDDLGKKSKVAADNGDDAKLMALILIKDRVEKYMHVHEHLGPAWKDDDFAVEYSFCLQQDGLNCLSEHKITSVDLCPDHKAGADFAETDFAFAHLSRPVMLQDGQEGITLVQMNGPKEGIKNDVNIIGYPDGSFMHRNAHNQIVATSGSELRGDSSRLRPMKSQPPIIQENAYIAVDTRGDYTFGFSGAQAMKEVDAEIFGFGVASHGFISDDVHASGNNYLDLRLGAYSNPFMKFARSTLGDAMPPVISLCDFNRKLKASRKRKASDAGLSDLGKPKRLRLNDKKQVKLSS